MTNNPESLDKSVIKSSGLQVATQDQILRRIFPAADTFVAEAEKASVADTAPEDLVLGRHLQARGLEPGPRFGEILNRCRDLQDETGWTDADKILDKVLGDG